LASGQEDLTSEHLDDPLLVGTHEAAQELLRTPLVLARVSPPREPLLHDLVRSLALKPGSPVLLAPAGVLPLLDHHDGGVEVGELSAGTLRRLEALAALVGSDGAPLPDLWEATEEL
jgi:hypothetical protein